MIELAVASGIPMSEWLDLGERAIITGLDVLYEARKRER